MPIDARRQAQRISRLEYGKPVHVCSRVGRQGCCCRCRGRQQDPCHKARFRQISAAARLRSLSHMQKWCYHFFPCCKRIFTKPALRRKRYLRPLPGLTIGLLLSAGRSLAIGLMSPTFRSRISLTPYRSGILDLFHCVLPPPLRTPIRHASTSLVNLYRPKGSCGK